MPSCSVSKSSVKRASFLREAVMSRARIGDAVHLIVAHHRVGDAVEIENGDLWLLDADLDDAGPVAALEKTRHGAVDQVASLRRVASSRNP